MSRKFPPLYTSVDYRIYTVTKTLSTKGRVDYNRLRGLNCEPQGVCRLWG